MDHAFSSERSEKYQIQDKSRTELNPGHDPEIKDCPGKSTKDGHPTLDSTAIRPLFDSQCSSTALRPFDDLRYDRRPTNVWATALKPK